MDIEVQDSERKLICEGMVSYGSYRVFGAAEKVKLFIAGIPAAALMNVGSGLVRGSITFQGIRARFGAVR